MAGLLLGSAGIWAVRELWYLDWHRVAAPVDQHPLMIRADAKGDGRYGAPRSGQRPHRGVDLEAPVGSPVRAIRSGQVVEVGEHRGLGRFLELEHRGELRSVYAHLDTVGVAVGDRVRQGQPIGTVGKTGNARHPSIRPHLHLEVSRDGEWVDPASLGFAVVEPSDRAPTSHAAGGE